MTEEVRNALPKGYEIEGFRVDGVLGAGGFGVTYLALDLSLNRRVAMKEYLPAGIATRGKDDVSVHPMTSSDKSDFLWGLERFEKEAQTLVAFSHTNIVSVHRFFKANGTAYLVMAYEDGESLAAILERAGTLTEQEIHEVLPPLLDGLEHVHRAGFLHRDIKPGNIYIRRNGQPVLLDFGAARLAMGGRSQSLTSIVSAGYAPFEQYTTRGNQGPWSDIYAMAGVLYRCAIGHRPPDAPDRIRKDPYVPAVEVGKDKYAWELLSAIDAGLNVEEEKRPQSIAEWRPMFELGAGGAAPASVPAADTDSIVTGPIPAQRLQPVPTRPPVAPPRPPATPTRESSGAWPRGEQGAARPMPPPTQPPVDGRTGPTAPPNERGAVPAPPVAPVRPGGARIWIIAGSVVAVLAAGGAGAWFYMEDQKKEKILADAKKKVEEAKAALARKAYDEADLLLDEAARLKQDLPDIAAMRDEVRKERERHTAELRGEKLRLYGQARVMIAEARVAVRQKRLPDAEAKLRDASALMARAAGMQGDTAAAAAEAQRDLDAVRVELETAKREADRVPDRVPDKVTGTFPGAWPPHPVLRKYVDESLKRLTSR